MAATPLRRRQRAPRRRPSIGPTLPAALALAVAAALVAAACSGSDGTDASPSPTPSAAAAPTTAAPTTPASPSADGVLRIGSLLPGTGSQASLGPSLAAAAQAAVADVNAAGGVNGKPVEYLPGDSGDVSTDTATRTVDRLVDAKVDVVVGPVSAGVADAVADRIAAAGLVLVSPANPMPAPPAGLRYVRTAPGDELRGRALAAEALAGGARTVVVLARADGYGERLGGAVTAALQAEGATVTSVAYNPEAEVYTKDATAVAAAKPQAIVLVGYAETVAIVRALTTAGVGPKTTPTWLLTDRLDDSLATVAGQPDLLTGVRGVAPAVELPAAFASRLRPGATPPKEISFAAETYDAVVLAALAATRAGSDDPAKLAFAFAEVSSGDRACTSVADCLEGALTGRVAHTGMAGAHRIGEDGAPTAASFAVRTFGADNKIDPTKTVYRSITS